jgi:hypothetical protein
VVIMQEAVPGIKRFVKRLRLSDSAERHVIGFIIGFVMHLGRMSATQSAQAIRVTPRHRAQVIRFLANSGGPRDFLQLAQLADLALAFERRRAGTWFLIIDQTYCTHQGKWTENVFSHGRKEKSGKDRRTRKKKTLRRCHCFVMGLLLTPSGYRIPLCRVYYTDDYLKSKNQQRKKQGLDPIPYRRQAELAAELISTAPVPPDASLMVLGDTAFDAESIQQACHQRRCKWIVPMNKDRVLVGNKPRRKVYSLVEGLSADQFVPVTLTPGHGRCVAQRRVAACRIGRKAKSRTFYVHEERLAVQSVGDVQVVFSTMTQPKGGKPVEVTKVLMTNDLALTKSKIVEWYDLRWQIELFFKELKGTLGLHQYRFRQFDKVERWVELCLIAFVYLEWYRAEKLSQRGLPDKEKRWWQWQRSHGLSIAVRNEIEERELIRLARFTRTQHGLKTLKKILRAARPLEERKPA